MTSLPFSLKSSNLPCLENESGLFEAVREGVRNGLFPSELTLEDVIVRPEATEKETVEKTATSWGTPEETAGGVVPAESGIKLVQALPVREGIELSETESVSTSATRPRRVKIKAAVPWDKFSSIVTGVVKPLKSAAPDCALDIVIELTASSPRGFDRTTIDTKVREILTQIGAEIMDWEEKEQ